MPDRYRYKKDYPRCPIHRSIMQRRGAENFICRECAEENNPLGMSDEEYEEQQRRKNKKPDDTK